MKIFCLFLVIAVFSYHDQAGALNVTNGQLDCVGSLSDYNEAGCNKPTDTKFTGCDWFLNVANAVGDVGGFVPMSDADDGEACLALVVADGNYDAAEYSEGDNQCFGFTTTSGFDTCLEGDGTGDIGGQLYATCLISQCQLTCNAGFENADGELTTGCESEIQTCTSPADKTGYTVTAEQLNKTAGFSVTVNCATDYKGDNPLATECSVGGADYTLSGCTAKLCTAPDKTGYNVTNEVLEMPTFGADVECADGYVLTTEGVNPSATVCSADGNAYSLSGCSEDSDNATTKSVGITFAIFLAILVSLLN